MLTPDPRLIEQAVLGHDASRVRELLQGATEAGRRACAKELRPLLREPDVNVNGPAFVSWRQLSETLAFVVAAVGLAGGGTEAQRALHGLWSSYRLADDGYDAVVGVLADRNPAWLAGLADRLLRERFQSGLDCWQLTRRLVRLGLIERPDIPEYTIMMPQALTVWSNAREPLPLGALMEDPGLLDDELWRLFTEPGAGKELDWLGDHWADALAELAARGIVDRGRLLDACLDAFIRDFPPNHVGWYARMHDRLAPASAEVAARSSRYLVLLSASSTPGVTLGQRECGALLDAGLLDPEAFLASCGPALLYPRKNVATAQLKLVGKLAARRPEVHDRALVTAATAFGHPREDVQAAALSLLARHGIPADGDSRAVIAGLAGGLSPVLLPDAVALGLLPDATEPGRAPQHRGPPADRACPQPAAPLDDPADLVQVLARLMEDATDALAVERALAGAVRLSSLPVADRARLAAPLLKRAEELIEWDPAASFGACVPVSHLAWLTLTWATGQLAPRRRPDWMDYDPETCDQSVADTISRILSARAWEACTLIAAQSAAPLLAEPEFTNGAISHDTLLSRLARWRTALSHPMQNDLEVALLRLAPGAGEEFWAVWDRSDVVSAGAVPPAAAARRGYAEALAPLAFDPVFLAPAHDNLMLWHPRQLPRVLARLTSPAEPAPASRTWRLLTDTMSPHHAAYGGSIPAEITAWPLLCPHQPDLIAAHLLQPLSDGLEPRSSSSTTAATCLADLGTGFAANAGGVSGPPSRTFGEVCHLALVTGLGSASADTRIAAAEAWTRASADGRLAPALAAEAIALGVTGSVLKLNRIGDGLQHAMLDAMASRRVAEAALAAAAALLPARPPGLHLLLEIAARSTATAVPAGTPELPAAITDLARTGDRTKLAEAARRLTRLAPPRPGSPHQPQRPA